MEAWQENLVERQQLLRLAGKLFAPYTLRRLERVFLVAIVFVKR